MKNKVDANPRDGSIGVEYFLNEVAQCGVFTDDT
jgi:hypothetical protein